MKNCKICRVTNLVLVALLAAMVYLFLIRGTVSEAEDGRTSVLLSEGERNHVLEEMRGFLEAVQAVTEGIGAGDMEAVAQSATGVGMILVTNEAPSLLAKLPADMKTQGFATHAAFDDLATMATGGATVLDLVAAMGKLTSRCTACHAGYRFDVEGN
jgi:cytochrome c556